MSLELADMIGWYPSPSIPEIQTDISGRIEFEELAGTPTEPPPSRPGTFYRHQELIGRAMVWMDRLLMFHETGTGKTCGMARVTEYFKRMRETGGHIKHAYILVSGPSLVREIKQQLMCVCTDGEYLTPGVVNAANERARSNNLTRALNKWYTIETYASFVKNLAEPIYETYTTRTGKQTQNLTGISEKMSDDDIIREYSNCIFFVDEVHNLRVTSGGDDDIQKKKMVYDQLWRVFHLVHRSKVILSTATPMINEPNEIGPILDLLLDRDEQFAPDTDFNTISLDEMEVKCRGKVSFVRALDTGAKIVYEGDSITTSSETATESGVDEDVIYQMKIYRDDMVSNGIQDQVYGQIRRGGVNVEGDDAEVVKREGRNFFIPERQAALITFPDGNIGEKGFREFMTASGAEVMEVDPESGRRKKPKVTDDYTPNEEMRGYLTTDRFNELSCKMHQIVDFCTETAGNCFVFSEFINPGAVMMGLALEYTTRRVKLWNGDYSSSPGFEKFKENTSIFSSENQKLAPPCARSEGGERPVRISKRPRYALLTSRTPDTRFNTIMEAFNSYENRHGEYIKVVIGSPVTRDGINLANVLQVHIAAGGWNPSSIYQAISRAIRSTSHVELLKEISVESQDELTEALRALEFLNESEMLDPSIFVNISDLDAAFLEAFTGADQYLPLMKQWLIPNIPVQVYRHAAFDSTGDSIDQYMYQLSETKEISIKRIVRILRQCAIDCQIHYARNVRDSDVDFTPECDYDQCQYECVNPLPSFLNEETYDLFYLDPEITYTIRELETCFSRQSVWTEDALVDLSMEWRFSGRPLRERSLYLALHALINRKSVMRNRFGFPAYLRSDGNVYYLQRTYPVTTPALTSSVANSYYTENLVAVRRQTLGSQLELRQEDTQRILIEKLRVINNPAELESKLTQISLVNQVSIFEDSLMKYFNETADDFDKLVVSYFSGFVHAFPEPVQELEDYRIAIQNKAKGPGRPPKGPRKMTVDSPATQPNDEENTVYAHNLFTKNVGNVNYNATTRYNKAEGRLRIYNPTERVGWRDTQEMETPVYQAMIQNVIQERQARFNDVEVFGTLIQGKFRIVDRSRQHASTDGRSVIRGKECKSWHQKDLFDIMYKLDVKPPENTQPAITDRDELIRYLGATLGSGATEMLSDFTLEKLNYFYAWGKSETIAKLCEKIQTAMIEQDLLYVD